MRSGGSPKSTVGETGLLSQGCSVVESPANKAPGTVATNSHLLGMTNVLHESESVIMYVY